LPPVLMTAYMAALRTHIPAAAALAATAPPVG
jgi:hypothetical protein